MTALCGDVCSLCGEYERRKDMALSVNITARISSGGDRGVPAHADICSRCAARPITDLADYFWKPVPRTSECDADECIHHEGGCPPPASSGERDELPNVRPFRLAAEAFPEA